LGDENKAAVETIRVWRLKLDSSFFLHSDETLYVPSFRRNLIFISLLDRSNFTVTFSNDMASIFFKYKVVGIEILINGLYKLNLHA